MDSRRLKSAAVTNVRGRLARPEGIADSARWLFVGLVLASVLVSLPVMLLSSGRTDVVALGVASAIVLTVMWTGVYLSGRFPLWRDGFVAIGLIGFALASPNPTVVFPFVFGGVWFGALYGSTWRSLTRCALYFAAVAATLPLWRFIPGHTVSPAPALVFGSLPALVLTVFVGRHLAVGLEAREQGLRRARSLADLGSRMLAVTDATTVRTLTSAAAVDICDATPGLRLLHVVRDGFALRVEFAAGEFVAIPTSLPRRAVAAGPGDRGLVVDPAELDSAVGAELEWVCLQVDDDQGDGWTLIGAPKGPLDAAVVTVRSLVVMMTLALRNSHVHQELSVQARVDSLTGLANRAAFTAALSDALSESAVLNPVHLLFVDLDDFKDVNDLLGHRAGDEVLTKAAARLRTCTRTKDVCARVGGDEFAVILVDTPAHAVTDIAERMVRALTEPFNVGGKTARIGASIGLTASIAGPRAGSVRTDRLTADELRHRADVAMYAAKANGKGRIQWFDSTLLPADLAASRSLA